MLLALPLFGCPGDDSTPMTTASNGTDTNASTGSATTVGPSTGSIGTDDDTGEDQTSLDGDESSGAPAEPVEVIGPYSIFATPTAGTIVGEPDDPAVFLPLHIVDVPISISEAFSGTPVLDDGWSPLSIGQQLNLEFAPGTLTNVDGPDLLLFSSYPADVDEYTLSVGNDDFSATVDVDDATATTVATKVQYFLVGYGGPYPTDVLALEIDLAELGLGAGEEVTSVRVQCRNDGCDPLGVVSLSPR